MVDEETAKFIAAQDQFSRQVQDFVKNLGDDGCSKLADYIEAYATEYKENEELRYMFFLSAYGLTHAMADLAASEKDPFS